MVCTQLVIIASLIELLAVIRVATLICYLTEIQTPQIYVVKTFLS